MGLKTSPEQATLEKVGNMQHTHTHPFVVGRSGFSVWRFGEQVRWSEDGGPIGKDKFKKK